MTLPGMHLLRLAGRPLGGPPDLEEDGGTGSRREHGLGVPAVQQLEGGDRRPRMVRAEGDLPAAAPAAALPEDRPSLLQRARPAGDPGRGGRSPPVPSGGDPDPLPGTLGVAPLGAARGLRSLEVSPAASAGRIVFLPGEGHGRRRPSSPWRAGTSPHPPHPRIATSSSTGTKDAVGWLRWE